jgi:antitoxin component YwqK of YwqJK toxin-antitoxin module
MQTNLMPRDAQGIRHGHWEVYLDNGQLRYKGEYVHGQYHGPWIEYHRDGSLWAKTTFDMGKRIGYHIYNSHVMAIYKKQFYAR